MDLHGIGRQQFQDNFQFPGIADFEQRLARRDNTGTFMQHAQDLTVHRRPDGHAAGFAIGVPGRAGAGLDQRRPCIL